MGLLESATFDVENGRLLYDPVQFRGVLPAAGGKAVLAKGMLTLNDKGPGGEGLARGTDPCSGNIVFC